MLSWGAPYDNSSKIYPQNPILSFRAPRFFGFQDSELEALEFLPLYGLGVGLGPRQDESVSAFSRLEAGVVP